jgi:hypothetical protein
VEQTQLPQRATDHRYGVSIEKMLMVLSLSERSCLHWIVLNVLLQKIAEIIALYFTSRSDKNVFLQNIEADLHYDL